MRAACSLPQDRRPNHAPRQTNCRTPVFAERCAIRSDRRAYYQPLFNSISTFRLVLIPQESIDTSSVRSTEPMNAMAIVKPAHFSIRTADLDGSQRFYTDVLQLRIGFRPPFNFPGVWLYPEQDESEFGAVHLIGVDPRSREGLRHRLIERR